MKNPRIPPGPLLLPCGMSRTDRKRRPRSPTLCRRQPPSLRLMIRVSHASFEEHNARRGEARQGLRTWLNARLEAAKGYGSDRDYAGRDRKSTRLNSSHGYISYAVFCLKKKKQNEPTYGSIEHNTDATSSVTQ